MAGQLRIPAGCRGRYHLHIRHHRPAGPGQMGRSISKLDPVLSAQGRDADRGKTFLLINAIPG